MLETIKVVIRGLGVILAIIFISCLIRRQLDAQILELSIPLAILLGLIALIIILIDNHKNRKP